MALLLKYLMLNTFLFCTLVSTSDGNLFKKGEDEVKSTYGCLETKKYVDAQCEPDEIITISQVLYGAEPDGCSRTFTDRNDCQQYSKSITDRARKDCDGLSSCRVQIVQIADLDEEIQWSPGGCNVGGQFHTSVTTNYMVVKFTCQAFRFCEKVPEMEVSQLSVTTNNYPAVSVTNPTCECTFKSGNDVSYVEGIAQCNGTVTFVVEETVPNPDHTKPQYIKQSKRYFCKDQMAGTGYIRIGSTKAISMTVAVDAKNSTEYSGFSISTHIYTINQHGLLSRKRDAKVGVACIKGALYLTSTVKLILYITIPLGTIIIIALIVLYCVIKKRRKRAKAWRRKHVKLTRNDSYNRNDSCNRSDSCNRNDSYNRNGNCNRSESKHSELSKATTTYRSEYKPDSPEVSETSSIPSTTRKKPEGKLDSDSDEDLTAIARKLHRQNTQRKADEMRKRELYYNNGIDGVWSQSRSNGPQQYYTELDRLRGRDNIDHQSLYGDRRCMSIGNLGHHPEDVDADDPTHSGYGRLKRTRSAANSHTNLKSGRQRSNRMPEDNSEYATPYYNRHQDHRQTSRNMDDTVYPSASSSLCRQPLYGEARSRSIANVHQPRGHLEHQNSTMHGSKSVSQSRTSLRSMKRRAPQPPGPPASSLLPGGGSQSTIDRYVADEMSYDPRYTDCSRGYSSVRNHNYGGASTSSRASTPTRSLVGSPVHRRAAKSPNGSKKSNKNSSSKRKRTDGLPDYFSPLPIYPPIKSKPKSSGTAGSSKSTASKTPYSTGADNFKQGSRTYSDEDSSEEYSEHDMDNLKQMDIIGGFSPDQEVADTNSANGDSW